MSESKQELVRRSFGAFKTAARATGEQLLSPDFVPQRRAVPVRG
jgi:hypothetical protein